MKFENLVVNYIKELENRKLIFRNGIIGLSLLIISFMMISSTLFRNMCNTIEATSSINKFCIYITFIMIDSLDQGALQRKVNGF